MPDSFCRSAVLLLMLAAPVSACGLTTATASNPTSGASDSSTVIPSDRAVAVVTSGCGDAEAGIGSGVLLTEDLIVTAAHVVANAKQVRMLPASSLPPTRDWPDFSPGSLADHAGSRSVSVGYLDRQRDLALLTIDSPDGPIAEAESPVSMVNLKSGQAVVIYGVALPDAGDGTVVERTKIVADEVGGSGRVERLGYRLAAATTTGDSGAGLWHNDDLAGIVFAVSTDNGQESWAVAGSEVEALLSSWQTASSRENYQCNPDKSRLESVGD